jgi:hypothetical protein
MKQAKGINARGLVAFSRKTGPTSSERSPELLWPT